MAVMHASHCVSLSHNGVSALPYEHGTQLTASAAAVASLFVYGSDCR
jgi:hypothetical protein